MNVLGLTPIDSALSVLGLNFAQIINDFIFTQTPLGALLFAAGFLFSLSKVVRQGNYKALIIFFFVFLSVAFTVLPKQQEGQFQSAQEQWGQSSLHSQDLKDALINYHQVPIFLSFINQGIDTGMFAFIHAIDQFIPQDAQFLAAPLVLQRSSLDIGKTLHVGIEDPKLKYNLDKFLEDNYLPALGMLKNKGQSFDQTKVWADDPTIISYYSREGNATWRTLKVQLKEYLQNQPSLNQDARAKVALLKTNTAEDIEDTLLRSLVQQELIGKSQKQDDALWQRIAHKMLSFFPVCYGSLQLIVLAAFPIVIMALYVSRAINVIVHYFKLYLWVKSWGLGAAFCAYASVVIARLQAHAASDISFAWERPYFCLAAAIFIYLVPCVTFLLINRTTGGNT